MKSFLIPILFVAAAVPAATFAKDAADPLCTSLRAFAASVKPNETRELTFHTSWGGNFKGESEQVMYAVRCNHNGYAPAQAVCAYLVKNASIEFAGSNAKRAISCLSPHTIFGPHVDFNQGDFSLSYGTPDRGSLVAVKLYEDTQLGGMALTISAEGY